jgi:Starch-binding associating with outer membrane
MKIRNYIYATVAVLMISVTSCKDQFELDLLNNPNAVTQENADIELYFNAIQLNFRNFLVSANQGNAAAAVRMRVLSAVQYDQYYSGGDNGIWSTMYANMFPDIDAMIALAEPEGGFVWMGAAKVMKAWALMTMVDMHGDIPYSEAGLGTAVPSPIADDQVTIYNAALAMLDEGIADLGNTAAIGKPTKDIYYGGSPDKWTRLANTLKMKWYLNTRLVNGGGAAFNAIVASGNYISSDADNFEFQYSTNQFNPNSRHPWYNQHYNSPTAGGDYMQNSYMLRFRGVGGEGGMVEDPRLRYYFYRQHLDPAGVDAFTLGCPGELKPDHYTNNMPFCLATLDHADPNSSAGYWGRDHGNGDGIPPDGDKRTNYGIYPAGGVYDADQGVPQKRNGITGALGDGIQPFLMSSYVDFMIAEAVLTMGVSGDARASLERGIRESISFTMDFASDRGDDGSGSFKPDAAAIDAYVNSRLNLYDAASADGKLDLVMQANQKASFGAPWGVFNGYRRTGFPSNMQFTEELDGGNFPRLMFYPNNYVNLNENATQRVITEQVFWDTNPAGFIN